MRRRDFLTAVGSGGLTAAAGEAVALPLTSAAPSHFGLHPFIEAHPQAVFIMRTNAAGKTDSAAEISAGKALAEVMFTLKDTPGIPLTSKIALKPNITANHGTGHTLAIVTDCHVFEGFVNGLKNVGIPAANMYARDGYGAQSDTGYAEMAQRTGIHYFDGVAQGTNYMNLDGGVVFKRMGKLGPFGAPDSYLINMCKMKAHSMGVTLCTKNLQGTNVSPYLHFCSGIQNELLGDMVANVGAGIDALYEKHKPLIPRWTASLGKLYGETWSQKAIDNYIQLKPTLGINIIEAVCSQDGDGFASGPGPDGKPNLFMTNMLIFGIDIFRVDILGHWLAGHEPGNFGLFHIARERGVSTALNPRKIAVYLWEAAGPRLATWAELEKLRQPLRTLYLARPGEASYHMVNEPFDYPPEADPVATLSYHERPRLRALGLARGAFGGQRGVIEYTLAADSDVLLDVYDAAGDRVAVLESGRRMRGAHVAQWNLRRLAPGNYLCRLWAGGHDQSVLINLTGGN